MTYVFKYCERTDRETDKQMAPLDSAHHISLEIIFNGILTALGRCYLGGDGMGKSWAEYFNFNDHRDILNCNS